MNTNRRISSILSLAVCLAMVLGFIPSQQVQAASPNIVISQVYGGGGNTGGIYTNDFVELFNRGTTTVSLEGWSIQYASATGTGNFGATATQLTPLSGSIAPGQYLLVQEAGGTNGGPLPTPEIIDGSPIAISGTGGKVALITSELSLGCNGSSTPCSSEQLAKIVDLVGWGTANFYETTPAPVTTNATAVIRNNGGCSETDNNGADFTVGTPTPRNSASPINICPVISDSAPAVASVSPANGSMDATVGQSVTVTFNEAVNVAGSWNSLTCSISGSHDVVVSGGPTSFVLDPTTDFLQGETCTFTVSASAVTDQDMIDPPDNMVEDFTSSFTTLITDPCTAPFTPIYSIQGSGLNAAITGTVSTKGVVVGDFEGVSPALRGFFLQDLTGDGDSATSDGIFVFEGNANTLNLGDVVFVTGTAADFQGQTQISSPKITKCGTGSVEPVDVNLPFASATDAEKYEGMLIRLPADELRGLCRKYPALAHALERLYFARVIKKASEDLAINAGDLNGICEMHFPKGQELSRLDGITIVKHGVVEIDYDSQGLTRKRFLGPGSVFKHTDGRARANTDVDIIQAQPDIPS